MIFDRNSFPTPEYLNSFEEAIEKMQNLYYPEDIVAEEMGGTGENNLLAIRNKLGFNIQHRPWTPTIQSADGTITGIVQTLYNADCMIIDNFCIVSFSARIFLPSGSVTWYLCDLPVANTGNIEGSGFVVLDGIVSVSQTRPYSFIPKIALNDNKIKIIGVRRTSSVGEIQFGDMNGTRQLSLLMLYNIGG